MRKGEESLQFFALAVASVVFWTLSFLGSFAAIAAEGGADVEKVGDLAYLLELERATIRVIEASKPAFVFIQGGSGFSISEDGYVLTNEHVVVGRERLVVTMTGGRRFRARVVGHDPQGDVALLKLEDASGIPHLELGDSDRLLVGQRIVALGDPFLLASESLFLDGAPPTDYEPSASLGVISALHRYSFSYNDAIQVDVAVNRGNSGGPLLTLDGKVVGINGKIETRFVLGINTGVGYAIPSNQIKRFLGPLKSARGGVVLHGTIPGLNVATRIGGRRGLPITGVDDDSPAAEAGFRSGDLLLSLGGLPVKTRTRYLGILGTYPAGDRVTAEVARGEKTMEISAVLVALGTPFLGVQVDGHTDGLKVTQVGSGTPASRAGLQVGDVITRFDGEKITTSTQLAGLIEKRRAGESVKLAVVRGDKQLEVEVQLGLRPK